MYYKIFQLLICIVINLFSHTIIYSQLLQKEKDVLFAHFSNTSSISKFNKTNGEYEKIFSANENSFHEYARELFIFNLYTQVRTAEGFCEAAELLKQNLGEKYCDEKIRYPLLNELCVAVSCCNILKGAVTESQYSAIEAYFKKREFDLAPGDAFSITEIEYDDQIKKLNSAADSIIKEQKITSSGLKTPDYIAIFFEYRYQKKLHLKLINDMEQARGYAENNINNFYDPMMIKLLEGQQTSNEQNPVSGLDAYSQRFAGEWKMKYLTKGEYYSLIIQISGESVSGTIKLVSNYSKDNGVLKNCVVEEDPSSGQKVIRGDFEADYDNPGKADPPKNGKRTGTFKISGSFIENGPKEKDLVNFSFTESGSSLFPNSSNSFAFERVK